jgi:hypothetical protein
MSYYSIHRNPVMEGERYVTKKTHTRYIRWQQNLWKLAMQRFFEAREQWQKKQQPCNGICSVGDHIKKVDGTSSTRISGSNWMKFKCLDLVFLVINTWSVQRYSLRGTRELFPLSLQEVKEILFLFSLIGFFFNKLYKTLCVCVWISHLSTYEF